ncbi:MAG: hypothetical protein N2V75_07870 [Methanophagales archaeon]|nr:hypothetical protein [Methanophagales archaeon]
MQENKKIIRGRENIENIIKSQLKKEKESLREEIRGWEGKFLFMTLWVMNYIYGPSSFRRINEAYATCDLTFYRVILCLKGILDTILEYKISRVKVPTPEEFKRVFELFFKVSLKYFGIAPLNRKLEITQSEDVKKIIIENGKIKDLEDPKLYKILGKWIDRSSSDPEWFNWYFTYYPADRNKAGKFLKKEFKETYDLELQDLVGIDRYFEQVSKQHIDNLPTVSLPKNIPFLYIERKKLLKDFSKNIGKYKAKKWIEVLEYKAWGDFRKCPLIPLKSNGKRIYTLIYWIFTPSNAFFDAWTSSLMLGDTQTAGKMRQSYGKVFQLYVDEKLKNSKIMGLRNLGGRLIKSSDFPEIQPWLDKLPKQREAFQVDKILTKEDLCFIVSCKARDFAFQRKIGERNFFFPLSEIKRQISQNEGDLKEIYIEAGCIAVNPKVRDWIGLKKQKYIVPILLTSRMEPLGIKDVKVYFLEDEEIKKVPVITIKELINLLKEPSSNNILGRVKYFRLI